MQSNQKLSQEEFANMLRLIQQYANDHMDQFEHWKLDTKWGNVYVILSNAPTGSENMYTDLTHFIVDE